MQCLKLVVAFPNRAATVKERFPGGRFLTGAALIGPGNCDTLRYFFYLMGAVIAWWMGGASHARARRCDAADM